MNRLDRDIRFLAELHQKAYRIQNFEEAALTEGRVAVLTEDVSKEDLAKLKSVIENFDKRLDSLKKQMDKLTSANSLPSDPDAMHPDANESANYIKKLIEDYDKGSASLSKVYGNLSFEKGGFGLGAKFVSIPAMVTIITEMLEDFTALIKGYEEFKQKILDTTRKVPADKQELSIFELNKDDDSPVPSVAAIIVAAKKTFSGKNVLQKAVAFLGKNFKKLAVGAAGGAAVGVAGGAAVGAGLAGAAIGGAAAAKGLGKFITSQNKEIQAVRAKIPQFDGKKVGEAFGCLFVSIKISSLKALPAPAPVPPVAAAQPAIQNAAASVTTQGVTAGQSATAATSTTQKSKLTKAEIDQLKILRDKLDPAIQKLIDPIIAAGPSSSRKKAAAPASPTKIPESRTRNFLRNDQQLLTSRRHKIQENSDNHDYDRWAHLAGIK